ncbi:Oligopeptide transporter OPT superfamily [Tolypocladium paradoxum]|uniref:Oligopeptide transporter OPT superfamily n=1 Tax=Tolypocladium paradoxum TaxID=94208 RepID=A0A2S4KVX5_9HYPO|nr:Oligopeptide transporter OPT superfamily [Tolypocladium paradoxum]
MAPHGHRDDLASDGARAQPTVITQESDTLNRQEKAAVHGIDEKAGIQVDSTAREGSASDCKVDQDGRTMYTLRNLDGQEEVVSEDDPRIKDIPKSVRRIVSLKDDPTEPTLTFRYFLMTILFVVPGAFVSQLSRYRTSYAPFSIYFVQIASNYVGLWLAKVLPAWEIRVPFTKRSFNLNPGPFSSKEHVLVTITAASGATASLGYLPISMSELYFGKPISAAVALPFMAAINWTGYSFAAIARNLLIADPQYPWYQSLCYTALFETQRKEREQPTRLSRKQMRVFFAVLLGVMLWQFLPEFVFPMLGSLAFLCWVAPQNEVANFIGSGFGGMGFLNLTLNWSNIRTGMFLSPWWTQVISFSASVLSCWVLMPAAKWGNLAIWNHALMSNRVFQKNGTAYPLTKLLTPDMRLNETAFEQYGELYVGAQYLWNKFFDYAAYSSALVWMGLFGYSEIKSSITKFLERHRSKKNGGGAKLSEQFTDQLNVLQRSYDDIPLWWFLALFLVSFVSMIAILATNQLFMPLWTYFVALATGALIVVPLAWLYSLSNFQLAIGSFNELCYGLMINAVSGYKNPCGASVYGSIAGNAWYKSQLFLQDAKTAHYMHIPPKALFFSQVFGSIIGIPIDYAVIRWVLDTKTDYISGKLVDPTHQWTGQALASGLSMAVQFVLIGPARIFRQDIYRIVPYGFLLGAVAPVIMFALHKKFPRAKFRLFNTTIFFSTMAYFDGNISTGPLSSFIGGFVVMFVYYRYRFEIFARWNYILAGAFDAGFNFNIMLIFLLFGSAKIIKMPHWWGNNEQSSDRCFALKNN